jgi:flagellar hook-associated protein 3 FlgL
MMRISAQIMADNIKANLAKQSTQLMQTQVQIATGKRINSLSDDPGDVGKVLDYRTTLATIDQYRQNINDAMTRVEYTETVLGQIHELIDDAQSIASNAGTDNREALAQQVANIRDQVMGLTNSKYAGNYIFSGYLTDTPAFDETTGAYNGDSGTRNVIAGDGVQVTLDCDGSAMFIESGDNLFTVLDDLEADLNADDEAGIAAAVDPLDRLDDQLELVRSQLAATYNRLETTDEHWQTFSNSVETMRSTVEDVDVTEAAINLQLQQTSYELLLQVAAEVIQPTLLDFL